MPYSSFIVSRHCLDYHSKQDLIRRADARPMPCEDTQDYELIDFGGGRKLERYGQFVLDRPASQATGAIRIRPAAWVDAHARYRRTEPGTGQWEPAGALPNSWTVRFGPLVFELRPTPFGHLGLFVEQGQNWRWIQKRIVERAERVSVLNLFGYTGGSTLAAASAGADVVHVDAARTVVDWARRNATLSALGDKPIRWITEDAVKFVRREARRGHHYQALILDPPSYGHGPKGEAWKLDKELYPLLELCRQILADEPAFVLLTAHSPRFGPSELAECLELVLPPGAAPRSFRLILRTRDDRELCAGTAARWPS